VIVHEAPKTCGFGAELVASIQERVLASLEAPILRVAGMDTPFPYTLEHEYLPNPERVLGAVTTAAAAVFVVAQVFDCSLGVMLANLILGSMR